MTSDWNPFQEPTKVTSVHAAGVELRPGDRVWLRPTGRADLFDMALAGKSATIESIEQDFEDRIYLAVTVDDDPGKDFGAHRKPAHRFFFRPDEVEPFATGSRENP